MEKNNEIKKSNLFEFHVTIFLILSTVIIIQPVKAPPMTWIPEIVDESTDVGDYNSLAFDSYGIPHIAYRRSDPFPSAVLHAYKFGDVWYNETVYQYAGIVGRYVSLAIDSKDILHISFFANDCLYYSTNASGLWQETIVDEDAWAIVGHYISIAVDSFDNPHIAYYDKTNMELKYAYYDGLWKIDVVDSGAPDDDSGQFCSLALTASDTPHISYYFKPDGDIGYLKHAWKIGNTWNDEIVVDEDKYEGRYTSFAIDDSGGFHISHYRLVGGDLMYSYKNGSIWTTIALETINDTGYYTSLALDNESNPHIMHFDDTSKEIKRTWKEMGSWHTEYVASPGELSNDRCLSIAMDLDYKPYLSYYDATNGNLMYANGTHNYVDLAVVDMQLNPLGPYENDTSVQTYVNITNLGTLSSGAFIVRFYDGDPKSGAMQIGTDQIVPSLVPGNNTIVSVNWTASPPGTHYIYVVIDPDDLIPDPFNNNDRDFIIAEVLGPKINLEPGWNLISLPLNQTDPYLTAIFDSISGDYDAVQSYNCFDKLDPWKHYSISKPVSMNDLAELNHTMGIWIHITNLSGSTFRVPGKLFSSPQLLVLNPGWNLVGFPSLSDKKRTTALNNIEFGTHVNAIWTHNATSKKWEKIEITDNFEIGRGYWIHSLISSEITWEVPL